MTKIRGEWWIYDHGIDFADGDVSDETHMSHVCNHVASEFLDAIREHKYLKRLAKELRFLEDSYDRVTLCETISNWADAEHTAGRVTYAQLEDVFTWICTEIEWDQKKFEILIGAATEGDDDPRNFAIKHLGWIKVTKNTLACQVLDFSTLKRIAKGLDRILEEEGLDDPADQILFDITTHSDSALYDDVPLSLIEGGELETILRRHRAGASRNLTIQPGQEPIA